MQTNCSGHDDIQIGAVLERVEFKQRQIVIGFDSGDRRLDTNSSLYRRGLLYPRRQQRFASQLVAQIGQRVAEVSADDERAKLRVIFDNGAVLYIGEYQQRTPAKRARRTHT
ncbi:hypothetical protein T31B1_18827 [Salinisphaera sp. T31B1]